MIEIETLRAHILRLLESKDAHASYDKTVEGFPAELRGVQPEGLPYSAWRLLEHIRLTQRDILVFCIDPAYVEPKWPDEYWPSTIEPPTPEAWDESVAGFRSDMEAFRNLIADPATDLFATIPHGTGQTYLREALVIADHNAYHVGELLVVRRLLGIWG